VRTWLQSQAPAFSGRHGRPGRDGTQQVAGQHRRQPAFHGGVQRQSGELLHRKIGKVLPEDLALWAKLT
jgi:hypothetical protein